MTMNEKMLEGIESIALEMRVELNGIKQLAYLIEDELFGRIYPEQAYTDNFEHFQALYHMMTNALYKFEGEFSLLTGNDETPYYEAICKRPEELREINKWWSAPRKVGKAV